MISIRIFLVVVLLATITLTLFLSALHGYRSSMAQAHELFDMKLSDTAHLLAATTSGDDRDAGAATVTAGQFAFQVWVDGMLKQHSGNVPYTPIARLEPGYQYTNFNNYRWRTFAYRAARERWILTAERLDLRNELGEGIIVKSVLPLIASLPVLGLLVWVTVGYGLSPLHRLATRLRNKRIDDLSALPVERQPRELIQVISSTNDLLHRLEASFAREKRITSDAAHELRTPISALKVHLHNLERDLPPGHHEVEQLKQSTERMGRLVEQMLLLNRVAPEQYVAEFRTQDLHALVQRHIADHYAQFEQRRQGVELRGSGAWVAGDAFALETLLLNLLDNACKYTPRGGQIRISVARHNGRVHLVVEDSGPGIPESQRERIFDRFYRLGGDQHASGVTGCGLGLSIVRHIADLHRAAVVLSRSADLGGLCVDTSFPAAQPPAGHARA